MTEEFRDRRYTDIKVSDERRLHKRIENVEQNLIECSNNVYAIINSFTDTMRKVEKDLQALTEAARSINLETLRALVDDHTEKQAFFRRSTKWGKRIVSFSVVGGAILSIWSFFTHWTWSGK